MKSVLPSVTSRLFLLLVVILFSGLVINVPELNKYGSVCRGTTLVPAGVYDLPSEYIVTCDEVYRSRPPESGGCLLMAQRDRQPEYDEDLHEVYVNGEIGEINTPYQSNIVVPRFALVFLCQWVGVPRAAALDVLHTTNCLLLAVCLGVILVWISKRAGALSVIVLALLMVLFTDNITNYGKNLYWQGWTFYAPMAISCVFADGMLVRYRLFRGKKMWMLWLFCALLYKQLCCFEFITCVVASAIIPVILHFLESGKNAWKEFFKVSSGIFAVFIVTFALCMACKLMMLSHDLGGLSEAWFSTLDNIQNRSINEPDGGGPVRAGAFMYTFMTLLRLPAFEIGSFPLIAFKYFPVLLALLHAGYGIVRISPWNHLMSPICGHMLIVAWFGFFATASWPMFAAPHLIKHYWIGIIILWVPFMLLVVAALFTCMNQLRISIQAARRKSA